MLRTLFIFAIALFALQFTTRADDFDSAGVKIHYTVEGKGEPVILIHGLYSSAMMNWGLPGITADLARNYQVIALDCRGHGQSDKPTAEGSYGVQMVEDVVRLMDHLHLQSAHIVGYSMGGMIAMKLAVLHPARVRSTTLGGMGWMQEGSPLQNFWAQAGQRSERGGGFGPPPALQHGFTEFAVTAAQVKAIKTPITCIVGDRDPCRRLYVAPLIQLRPEIPEHVITGAGHIACVTKPEFKAEVHATLAKVTAKAG